MHGFIVWYFGTVLFSICLGFAVLAPRASYFFATALKVTKKPPLWLTPREKTRGSHLGFIVIMSLLVATRKCE
jgi:hypothetical protein